MSEISKFEATVKNAEKFKSPEIRLSFPEAKSLLLEIQELRNQQSKITEPTKKEPSVVNKVVMDGGKF